MHHKLQLYIFAWISMWVLLIKTAVGAAVTPIPIDLLINRETVLTAGLSHDGRWLAMIMMRVGEQANGSTGATPTILTTTLRVVEVSTGKLIELTPQSSKTDTFAWAPSQATLAFDVQINGERQLWLWHTGESAGQAISKVQLRRGNIVWTRDPQAIVVPAVPKDVTASALETGERISNKLIDTKKASSAATVIVYRSSIGKSAAKIQDFASNNRFRSDLARINIHDSSVEWLTAGDRPQGMLLSPDGRWIAYATLTGQIEGNGYRNLFDLSVVPASGSAAPRIIAHDIESISALLGFSWSPTSDRIAFIARSLRKNGLPGKDANCYFVGLENRALRRVETIEAGDEEGFSVSAYRTPLWDAGGDAVYLIGTRGIWRADLKTAQAKLFSSIPGKKIRQIIAPKTSDALGPWARSNAFLVIARDGQTKVEGFYRIHSRTGQAQPLLEEPANFSSSTATIDVSADGRIFIYPRETAYSSEQLWVSGLDLRRRRQITNLNPQLNSFAFGQSRLITWQGANSKQLQGSLLLPAGYQTGQRYPLIVQVYGGDKLSDSVNLFGGSSGLTMPLYNTQFLATHGFAVLEPDTYINPGTMMRDIADSVLPAVDKAIELGIADPKRLGVRGQSNGGYSVLALLVQSQRFNAAVVSAGFSNLFSMYGQMHADGTHWAMSWVEDSDRMGGTPWEQQERYIKNSPFFYLDKINAPVLLIHGSEDTAVQPYLADEVFISLRHLGKEVEYIKYVGEGHTLLKRENVQDAANRMTQWFERHFQSVIN